MEALFPNPSPVFAAPLRQSSRRKMNDLVLRPHALFPSRGRYYNSLILLLTAHPSVDPLTCFKCNVLSKQLNFQAPLAKEIIEEQNEVKLLNEKVAMIKGMLTKMGDGEISISAYDTAWVALIHDIHSNSGGPLFPSSIQWIIDHQLVDGSWGDEEVFNTYDRLINTLSCIIALKFWRTCPEQCARGVMFLRDNMHMLGEEDEKCMPIGFEVAFPSLIDIARTLDFELPFDSQVLQRIYSLRSIKLERIPKDLLHKIPTTLLHSLEGMGGLDWERLLCLKCIDGSFLFSPSSTAYALMQTGDEKCLQYLQKVIARFDGGVPNVYPVDLFERLWVVDRLERLGIARHFQLEIKECLDYVYKYWTKDGISWARNTTVHDIDDTAMGFRLLRTHGYDVSPDVFQNFQKDGHFFCFAGQSNQAVTGMYNLNRAAQVAFPKENILEEAKIFSYYFLREKQAQNKLVDKWIITKDLPGEVKYALDFPWYMSMARVEARLYLEQYGGHNDVWIGKTLYRMPLVNNNTYLEFARSDFNQCQVVHQEELSGLQRLYVQHGFDAFGVSHQKLLKAYYLAVSNIFEPERPVERLGWVWTTILVDAVVKHIGDNKCSEEMKQDFINEFHQHDIDCTNGSTRKGTSKPLVQIILQRIESIALDAAVAVACRQGNNGRSGGDIIAEHQRIRQCLRHAWNDWMVNLIKGKEDDAAGALLLARTLELCAGRLVLEEAMSSLCGCDGYNSSTATFTGISANHSTTVNNEHQMYVRLAALTSSICCQLQSCKSRHHTDDPLECKDNGSVGTVNGRETDALRSEMQELVQGVLQNPNGSNNTKQTFLTIAKTFYYASHCPPVVMDAHIAKVLFERVV